MRKKSGLISISVEEALPERDGKLDIEGLRLAASEVDRLLRKGLWIIAVVGAGSLGIEYAKISRAFSKNTGEIRNKAAEVNSLLFIAALRNLKIPVNSSPILDASKMDEFLSNPFWRVAVVANQEGEKRSSLLASDFAKRYQATLSHIINASKLINVVS